ncbi:hypothetical protein JYU14_03225 [Simkania negevensis]|uniref:N-acetyltransferase domain-containing protein n=1 Tax=Simkania negevensis TaxID=83561 RepID=A0ABS3AQR9_9BACT|nr:hypothetical protein [Simkania negevensis]
MKKLSIRRYQPSDIEGIAELYRLRSVEFFPALFEWKKSSPSSCSWVVTDMEGRLLGHYCLLGFPLSFGGGDLVSDFGVDGVTHPSAAHLEVVSLLLDEGKRYSETAEHAALFAFPNESMERIKRFLGWQKVADYVWIESVGKRIAASSLPLFTDDYRRWRWNRCPRKYVYNDERTAIFALGNTPMLLWCDGEEVLKELAKEYSFRLLFASECAIPDGFSINGIKGSIPLLVAKSEGRGLPSPLFWTCEAVEAVTLGW